MILLPLLLATQFILLTPIDPQAIHPQADHASFELQGFTFDNRREETPAPTLSLDTDGVLMVNVTSVSPLTGSCQMFELVDIGGQTDVAMPIGAEHPTVKGRKHHIRVYFASDEELLKAQAKRPRPAVGEICWTEGNEDHPKFSMIYQMPKG